MKFNEKILKLFLILFSIILGISFIEIFARSLGLGFPLLYDSDSLVGYRLKPNQFQIRRKDASVTSDFEGFRINPNIIHSTASKYIVFVGDSVTYGGSYIDDKDIFSSKYCQLIKENNICLNNGINSWGTMNMGRFISNFEIYSKRIPQKFVLVILPGDERRNLRSFTDTPFWSNYPKNPKGINEVFKFILLEHLLPFLQSKNQIKDNQSFEKVKNKKLILQREQAWKELNSYIENSKYDVDIIITPPKRWFKKEVNMSELDVYNNLLSSLESKKIKRRCNLFNFLKNDYSPELYVDSVHLSKKGHHLWAKKINQCLSINP